MLPTRPTVMLADDHAPVLAHVARALTAHYDVVGCFADGAALVDAAERLSPDLVVVDLAMPVLDGLSALRALRARGCKSALVVLTVHEEADVAAGALRSGASGFVVKNRIATDLLPALRAAREGGRFVSPTVLAEE